MWDLLLIVYLSNAVLLIDHEIDSAYWREWELFKLPGSIGFFLLLHIPLLGLVLWGLILVARQAAAGLLFSLGLGLAGLLAFGLHVYFLKNGRPEFKTTPSLILLTAILLLSLVQSGTTLYFLMR